MATAASRQQHWRRRGGGARVCRCASPSAASNTPRLEPLADDGAEEFESPFVLSPARVSRIRASLGEKGEKGSDDALLAHLIAESAVSRARPPISRFHVGAAALGASGTVYLGVNVELAGAPLSQSIHGEQFVVANAFNHGETGIETLAVNELPCGHCRQFLAELERVAAIRIIVPGQGLYMTHEQLLPFAFTPDQLQEGPHVRYMLSTSPDAPLELEQGDQDDGDDALVRAALDAAKKSYCPYSRCESGVALRLDCGIIVAGAYLESAAYNPSLPPLQVALVRAIVAGKGPAGCYDTEWASILEVVLVERPGAAVEHEHVTRAVVSAIAPAATVRVVHIS